MIIITTAIIIIIKMTILKIIKKATLLFVPVFNCSEDDFYELA